MRGERARAARRQRHFCSTSNAAAVLKTTAEGGKLPPQLLHSVVWSQSLSLSLGANLTSYNAALRDSFNNNPEMMSVFGFCTPLAEGSERGMHARERVRCKGPSALVLVA